MTASIARRTVLAGSLLALPAFANDAAPSLAELEHRVGGRLGVAALDTASGRRIGHRLDERPGVGGNASRVLGDRMFRPPRARRAAPCRCEPGRTDRSRRLRVVPGAPDRSACGRLRELA